MVSLEEKLTPPHVEQPWARDTLGLGLLIALAAVFYPFWQVSPWRYITDVAGQMASPHLLPALGFCLALRCGAIDLSVWASASLGGLVAGGLINAGAPPGLALAAACAAGLAPGAINAALVSFARLPSPIVTLAVALTSMWAMQAFVSGRAVAIPEETFKGWQFRLLSGQDPKTGQLEWLYLISLTRMLIVGLCWAAVMSVLFAAYAASRQQPLFSPRWSLVAALCASGSLASLGGFCWLMQHENAPLLTRPIAIGDLRVVAAPILAGALFFAGRGRSMTACLSLPPAMLLATIWLQEVYGWNMVFEGYRIQLVQLAVMVMGVHLAMAHLLSGRARHRWLATTAAAVSIAGFLATAGAARGVRVRTIATLYVAGTSLWGCGVIASLASRLQTETLSCGRKAPHTRKA